MAEPSTNRGWAPAASEKVKSLNTDRGSLSEQVVIGGLTGGKVGRYVRCWSLSAA